MLLDEKSLYWDIDYLDRIVGGLGGIEPGIDFLLFY